MLIVIKMIVILYSAYCVFSVQLKKVEGSSKTSILNKEEYSSYESDGRDYDISSDDETSEVEKIIPCSKNLSSIENMVASNQITKNFVNSKDYGRSKGAMSSSYTTIEVSNRPYQARREMKKNSEYKGVLTSYPYSVSIQRKGAHYATGALVGKRWVLSAAAEFYNVRETIRLFRIRMGSVNCKKGGVLLPLKNIEVHPSFSPGRPAFDVAMLKTAELVPTSKTIKPIAISKVGGKIISAKFLTAYWPRIVVKGVTLPSSAKERVKHTSMRVSTQTLVPPAVCRYILRNTHVTLQPSTLCLEPLMKHHSDCMPDVGAPITASDGLWGITSGWISPQCPQQPGPTLFTRVTSTAIRDWIYKLVQSTET